MSVTIYHNPACGTSRNTLAMIRASRHRAHHHRISQDAADAGRAARPGAAHGHPLARVLRQKGTPYAGLGLDDPALSDEALLDAIEAHPILINRPIVVTPKGVRLCRPSETRARSARCAAAVAEYIKEDGERVAARPA